MAFAVTNIGTNRVTSTTTVSVTVGAGGVPGGSKIVVGTGTFANSASDGSVADSASNSYGSIIRRNYNNTQSSGHLIAWKVDSATALVQNNTITYTSPASANISISACYVTGAGDLDTNVTAGATGSGTTVSVTSGTPSEAGELFIGIAGAGGNAAPSQDTGNGWASPPNSVGNSGPLVIGGNQVNSGTGTKTYAPTLDKSQNWAAVVFAFKEPAAANTGNFFALF
jgi:hypothetical protein